MVAYVSGATIGYYVMAAYLLSATIRPAAAYFAHLRERISTLSRESLDPREDVVELRLGDQQELLAGLRALVRMVRAEPA